MNLDSRLIHHLAEWETLGQTEKCDCVDFPRVCTFCGAKLPGEIFAMIKMKQVVCCSYIYVVLSCVHCAGTSKCSEDFGNAGRVIAFVWLGKVAKTLAACG